MRPTWSPDGEWIAYNTDRDGTYQVYIMNADGSHPRRLTQGTEWLIFPTWSPDGNRILFTAMPHLETGRNAEVRVINMDGTGERNLTDHPSVDEDAVFSPDGRHIVFQSNRAGKYDIYIMDADGSNLRLLVDDPANAFWPDWTGGASR